MSTLVAVIRPGANPIIKVGESTAEATRAATAAAASAADAAQSAAYAGGFETPEYATQAAGNAATTVGQIFRVPLGTSPQTFNWYRRLVSGSELVSPLATSAALAAPDGAGSIGLPNGNVAQAIQFVTPQMFGAVGYATAAAALAGVDSTAAMQTMANQASGAVCDGGGLWYKVSTVEWPSGSSAWRINAAVPNTNADSGPFFVNGQTSLKSDITFLECEVNGNRIGRTNMTTSGGDGQSAGFKIFGRTSNIRMVECRADYCATDGFFVWTGSIIPANADDILHDGLQIIDCSAEWNGRHGASFCSHKNTTFIGGVWKNNGKDIPGFSGVYSSGGYGRRVDPPDVTGRLYGRGWTHEEFYLGEHFENWRVEGVDARGNISGPLIFRCMFPTKKSARDLTINSCLCDDPTGGVGDGSIIFFAVNVPNNDGSGSRTVYTGTDAFDGVYINGSWFGRNYMNISNARKVSLLANAADISASQYSVIWTNCTNVLSGDVKSNKPQLGRPSLISRTSTVLPLGWAEASNTLSAPRDLPGSVYSYQYKTTLTPDGAGLEKVTWVFTSGYALRPTHCSALNNNTGAPVLVSLVEGGNAVNQIDLWVNPADASPLVVQLTFEAEPVP